MFNLSLRKINCVLILFIFVFLLFHGISCALLYYGLIPYSIDYKIMGRRLFILLSLHIIISLYLFIKSYIKTHNVNKYYNLNKDMIQQIVTGVLIIVLILIHVFNYSNTTVTRNINLFRTLCDYFLFINIILHLRVSIPRLLISFGFLDGENSLVKFKKLVNIILGIILIFLILSEIVFYGGFI